MSAAANQRRLAEAGRLLDRAALALALAAATGGFRLVLPCQGRVLLPPARTYFGRWESVGCDGPPHEATGHVLETWPAAFVAYNMARCWLAQTGDRVNLSGLHGRSVVELAGGRAPGELRVRRLVVVENGQKLDSGVRRLVK